MSMERESSCSVIASRSASSTITNSPLATSQPFTISSGPTSRSWVGHQRFWRIGVLHSRWSVRKLTSDCFAFGVVARARPTGMLTRPKEMDPFQIVRMGPLRVDCSYPVPDFSLAPAFFAWIGPIRRVAEGLLLRGLVRLAVAERLPERRSERQRGPLESVRDQRQPDIVEVVAGDDGQPQGVRHTLLRGLAVGREAEHRLDQLLERARRPDLAREAGGALAGVPELVGRPRQDGDALAGAELDLLAAHLEPHAALEHLEALGLVRVGVRRRDRRTRPQNRLDEHDPP